MRVFINATIVRPRYDSQTKENLITEVKEYKTSWEVCDDLATGFGDDDFFLDAGST